MEIQINNNPVDVQIENEDNAFEVVRQIDDWLCGQGYFISSILLNGRASSPSEQSVLQEVSLEGIETLDISALPLDELSIERFSTLLMYFSYFQQALREKDRSALTDLYAESPHIIDNMDQILRLNAGSRPVSEVFTDLLKDFDPDAEVLGVHPGLAEFLANIRIFIEGRIREISNPLLELKSTLGILDSQIPKLEDVPILLQTGKEREAMEMVIAFTEISEKLTRIYPLLTEKDGEDLAGLQIDEKTFGDFYIDLNSKFQELIEALEAEDSILIGDLLEYEIAPKVRELVKSIDELPAFSVHKA